MHVCMSVGVVGKSSVGTIGEMLSFVSCKTIY